MKIGIVAPSPIPYTPGGIENLALGLCEAIHKYSDHQAELLKVPVREDSLLHLLQAYLRFRRLPVSHFDLVITFKYPSWAVRHPYQVVYMAHRLRGLYDTYEQSRAPGDKLFRFPGPAARRIIKWLDDQALDPRRIVRYTAISRTVAERPDYFPIGERVDVIHPPPTSSGHHSRGASYLLAVGRLDRPKRLELAVLAMRHLREDIPLLIAGDGPQRAELRALAHGDTRIRFLGQVSDDRLLELYAGALAVIFTPYQEDYGYITIEAMKSAKPVITCNDSGGALEFVRDGGTGLVTTPEPMALAEAIHQLTTNPERAAAMGREAADSIRSIAWPDCVRDLLGPFSWPARTAASPADSRRWMTVLSTYPMYPPRGGGQVRLYHLLRHLARYYQVNYVCFCGHEEPMTARELEPGLFEVRVPPSHRHARRAWELETRVGVAVFDAAMPRLWRDTPAFRMAAEYFMTRSDILVTAHPYLIDCIERSPRTRLVVYEAANHEYELKKPFLRGSPAARRLLRLVRRTEERATRTADLLWATSAQEGADILDFYYQHDRPVLPVPNGVDTSTVRPATQDERIAARHTLGLQGPAALFMGAWHPPNLAAFRFLLENLAPSCPGIHFLVIGSVKAEYESYCGELRTPPNLVAMGEVTETVKKTCLQAADVALNPVIHGSGTNLKMFEYMAAGLPVISTPTGARGLPTELLPYLAVAPLERFAVELAALVRDEPRRREMARGARRLTEERFDWRRIASDLHTAMESLIPTPIPARLDLSDERHLWGFWPVETWRDERGQHLVRWTGRMAGMYLANPKRPSQLVLRMQGNPLGGAVRIVVDGHELDSLSLATGWRTLQYRLPEKHGGDAFEIGIEAATFIPDDISGSGDRRELGVAMRAAAVAPEGREP
ncbi:glycosyltransferase family 4 protein [bacterium]|nr:glycosyltransferase family 4 protein [candidate division CSSED10-310 bacterium]